jgi:hypothetical protein
MLDLAREKAGDGYRPREADRPKPGLSSSFLFLLSSFLSLPLPPLFALTYPCLPNEPDLLLPISANQYRGYTPFKTPKATSSFASVTSTFSKCSAKTSLLALPSSTSFSPPLNWEQNRQVGGDRHGGNVGRFACVLVHSTAQH